MREIDRRIASLRLRLAEVSAREDQLKALQRQFKGQLEKVTEYAVYDRGDLDAALAAAEEVEARLRQTESTLRHLGIIRARGQEELDALLLTRSIEVAKTDLAELEERLREMEAELERVRAAGEEPENRQRQAELQVEHTRIKT